MNRNYKSLIAFLCMMIGISGISWAQAQNPPANPSFGQKNPLFFLDMAIQKSGAPALTADQRSQLENLIQNYQSTWRANMPNPAIQAAHQNYQNAVLSGDSAAAKAAADALAAAIANEMPKHLESKAEFEVQALHIIQPQENALRQEIGNGGLSMLLGCLGMPGMHHGMGMSSGMGMWHGMGRFGR
jgi:Spy/CpxP family protein refolding chaperone